MAIRQIKNKTKAKTRKKENFSRWDAAEHLHTDKDIVLYLQACMDEGGNDPAFIAAALGDVARARGMVQLARKTGLTREALYKTLSPDGNPNLSTLLKVLTAFNVKLSVKAA